MENPYSPKLSVFQACIRHKHLYTKFRGNHEFWEAVVADVKQQSGWDNLAQMKSFTSSQVSLMREHLSWNATYCSRWNNSYGWKMESLVWQWSQHLDSVRPPGVRPFRQAGTPAAALSCGSKRTNSVMTSEGAETPNGESGEQSSWTIFGSGDKLTFHRNS